MSQNQCKTCGKPLNEAQWRENDTYKFCHRCSVNNGKEHVYYRFPDNFGTIPKRITKKNAQSYCVPCRGNGINVNSQDTKLCSEF